MSRQINQPVQSIKLTNVATVRLTVQGKRFEVACYKNKVLDYRAGLETDLSEVLQSPHIFTSVAQGQFAAASDLQTCFGDGMEMEQIAIQILQRGKSLQVGAAERAQQYEQTLAQIATWLATNCHHPVTGKPYTVSQIRHALTTTSRAVSGSAAGGSETNEGGGGSANHATNAKKGGKKKKHNNKKQPASDDAEQQPQQNQQNSFTVQPHKPIKQQYLAAFKYLQNVQQLPIQRAAMRLQWEYPVDQHDAVTKALTELHITSSTSAVVEHPENNNNDETSTKTKTILLTVDPSLYRPLHELATNTGSNLEIVQQQVFPSSSSQQQSRTAAAAAVENNTTATKTTAATCSDTNGNVEAVPSNPDMNGTEEEEEEEEDSEEDDDEDHPAAPSNSSSSSSSSSDDEARQRQTMRPNQRQTKKKKQQKKQAQRRQQQQQLGSSSSSDDENDEDAPPAASHMPPNILEQQQLPPSNDTTTTTTTALPQTNVTVQTCNTCVGEANAFATPAAYRAHFRSDWHRYNQKLKLQGAKAISLQEFEQCDAEAFFASLDRD